MLMNKILKQTILASVLLAATVMAQTPYDEGQKALREQNWTEAADQFKQAIKEDKDNADASMYWRAHALYKAGRKNQAERQVRSLERKHPDSRWVKEARVLQIEHDGSEPVLTDATDESVLDEELRLFALARLMDRDPERALPLVLDMMQSTDSESVRRDTLFMLGMSEDPRAQQAIAQIARDSKDPALQVDAIHMLGIASNQPSLALLADLYRNSDSDEVKRAVIQAYIVGDGPESLVDLLESEQNPELQIEIIHAMGVMDATDDLRGLYPTLASQETRIAALEALSIAGDSQVLREVLNTETDPELRKTAIQGIAMEGGKDASALLESIYDNATSVEEKKMVLESLVMMDEAEDLALKIVRTESDPELRRDAIHMLGVMEATEEMAALYASIDETELRKVVLESMMIADDTDGLIKVLQSEQDTELRAAAIQALAISDDDEAAQYLVTIYPDGSREEKEAVIQSMMIMENTQGLISLLKTETDPELKREMLQMLTIMDSEASDEYLFELLENKG
jgi:tetratricopeptide (TPR) repeat protein